MEKYGLKFQPTDELNIEKSFILGGKSRKTPGYIYHNGVKYGEGLFHHWKAYISLLWRGYIWHRWNELMLKEYLKHKETSLLGPASSGKTGFMAIMALGEYWLDPENTIVLCSTTTLQLLDMRIMGEIKQRMKEAKERRPDLPGTYLAAQRCFTTEPDPALRDLRKGIVGIACRKDGKDLGLSSYAGIKQKRVRLFADEGSYMTKAFLDGANNLDVNPDFKMVVSGNPNDPTDALGTIAEPSVEEGGWEGISQGTKTRTWKTRRAGGVTIQLVGEDSPNFDYPEGIEPFSFLIGRKKLNETALNYGKDSQKYKREAMGHMPIGGSISRVITRQLCRTHGATEEAIWNDNKITTVTGLDASYASVGGDRTVLVPLRFGKDKNGVMVMEPEPIPIIVPVKNIPGVEPEYQIAEFVKKFHEERGIKPENFGFDGTGRSSLTSAFARTWSTAVSPIEFGGKATNRPLGKIEDCSKKYGKFVTELWFAVRQIIEAGQMRGLTDPYINEGILREYKEKNGIEDVLPKKEIKDLLGLSPDIFDALVCAVEMARRRGFVIISPHSKAKSLAPPKWLLDRFDKYRNMEKSKQLTYV